MRNCVALICVEYLTFCLLRTVFTLFLTLTLFLKGIVDPKMKICHALTIMSFRTCMTFLLSWKKRTTFKFLFTVCLACTLAFKSLSHMCIMKTCRVKTCWKKAIQVWNDGWLSNGRMHFSFEWTIPNHERPLSLLICLNSFLCNKRLTQKAILIYFVSCQLFRWTINAFWYKHKWFINKELWVFKSYHSSSRKSSPWPDVPLMSSTAVHWHGLCLYYVVTLICWGSTIN